MVGSKITLSKILVKTILDKRIEKGLSASDLSIKIGRTASYISTIENGRIAKISLSDLIKIISVLCDLSESEAVEYIENLINNGKIEDDDTSEVKILSYDQLDDVVNSNVFNGQIKEINKAFKAFYKHDPKQAFITLNTFIQSLRSDLGFIMVILNIPFSNLETYEEKQEFLNKLIDLFSKYSDQNEVDEENI